MDSYTQQGVKSKIQMQDCSRQSLRDHSSKDGKINIRSRQTDLSTYWCSVLQILQTIQLQYCAGGLTLVSSHVQITGAATGPSGEIIQEGAEDAEGSPAARQEPGRFTHPDQLGDEEIDLGNREWVNFAQYWEVFKYDESLLCTTVKEAGDGRRYNSRSTSGMAPLPSCQLAMVSAETM